MYYSGLRGVHHEGDVREFLGGRESTTLGCDKVRIKRAMRWMLHGRSVLYVTRLMIFYGMAMKQMGWNEALFALGQWRNSATVMYIWNVWFPESAYCSYCTLAESSCSRNWLRL